MKKNAAGIEYITVSEYAKIKGVSSQAVYKQLNKRLKPFFIMVENQKCLLSTVLDEVETEGSTEVEQPFNNHSTESLNQSLIATMQKTIEVLQNQL